MPIDNDIFADVSGSPKKDAGERDIFADLPREKKSPSSESKVATQPDSPSSARVLLNSISKGIGAGVDTFGNLPWNVWNLAKAGAGTAMTAAGRPDLAPNITQTPDFAGRAIRAFGAVGPAGEPVTPGQRILDYVGQSIGGSALAPVNSTGQLARNLILGATSGAAAGGTKELTGSDTAAMAVGMVTPVIGSKVAQTSAERLRAIDARRNANSVNDATLAAAKREGYVIPPSESKPSFTNNRLEGFAGKAAIKQEAALRNQEVTNKIAARELGFPEGTPITEGKLQDFRNSVSAPYREVANLSPLAQSALEKLRDARFESKLQWNYYNRTGSPEAFKNAKAIDQKVDLYETGLERIAARSGKPELIDQLRDARTQIAKSYDIERALNIGDASVSAPVVGRALDKGTPLSGGLETIGRFAEGPGRRFVTETSRVPPPGVSGGEIYGMAGMGALGSHALGPAGAIAGGIPLLRGPARSLLLSKAYQNSRLANPSYNTGQVPQFTAQELALISLISGREKQ